MELFFCATQPFEKWREKGLLNDEDKVYLNYTDAFCKVI
jgi:hypothetical protein